MDLPTNHYIPMFLETVKCPNAKSTEEFSTYHHSKTSLEEEAALKYKNKSATNQFMEELMLITGNYIPLEFTMDLLAAPILTILTTL